ncbi:hydroxyacylglutathione hydrolase [Spartinivicinus poritis]|uniref:Hydroxyacylglutathione hydrolase n=1 Tax=Spartinivicinus poritis TaxID=2994640 RepID=A0ABT5U3Z3_9GAMM|nr:hydroxyacylglutathione hydrolase [Spartinivicinus sp. A2-2]MDE1461081.1 hydroxyacylglutathione hydrolase [Spartinivicinus sp. A2-2]
MIHVSPISAFNDNYIWLLSCSDTHTAWVVDPGDAAPVNQYLNQHQLTLAGILITHHHYDHVGGLKTLLKQHNPVTYGPANESIEGIQHSLSANDLLNVLGAEFQVLEVGGHTRGHIAYYSDQLLAQPTLFCGDTLFAGGCGRLFEGTPKQMYQSLSQIAALPANTLIYCAHEYTSANLSFASAVEPTNNKLQQRINQVKQLRSQSQPTVPSLLGDELATNPFLRCQQAAVKEAASQHAGKPLDSPVEVFAMIRQWKDHF